MSQDESKKAAKIKTSMGLPKAIEYLEDVLTSLKGGSVSVHNGSNTLLLKPAPVVRVEFEAAQKSRKESIAMRISWRKDEPPEDAPELRIGAERSAVEAGPTT